LAQNYLLAGFLQGQLPYPTQQTHQRIVLTMCLLHALLAYQLLLLLLPAPNAAHIGVRLWNLSWPAVSQTDTPMCTPSTLSRLKR
jgi:hypothetical protein